jgi:hypothetical protein
MIKSVISSAARLPLAPAKLAGRMSGSLLRQLRGNGDEDPQRTPSARTEQAPRRRAAQPRRAAGSRRPKAQRKRASSRSRAKAQPKRAAASAPKAQPTRASRPKPLDDATIARRVETTVFRDLEVGKGEVDVSVAEGVVSLGGEVPTPDLIRELEARANKVSEVRRVENRLRLPAAPAAGSEAPAQPTGGGRFQRQRPEDRAAVPAETREEAPTPATPLDSAAADATSGGQEGEDASDKDEPDVSELDKDSAYQPGDPSLRGLKGG